MKFSEMFMDNTGKLSQSRIQTFIAFVTVAFLVLHSYLTGKPVNTDFVYALLAYATAQKVGNKAFEKTAAK